MGAVDRGLVLWAGCVQGHELLARAEAVAAGGFAATSMRERGGPLTVLDSFLTWYPGGSRGPGAASEASPETMLRFAEELGARRRR